MKTTTKSQPDENGWLSIADLASELGMSQMTLYRLIDKGQLPAVRFGRRLFVPAGLLDKLAAAALSTGGTVNVAEWRDGGAA